MRDLWNINVIGVKYRKYYVEKHAIMYIPEFDNTGSVCCPQWNEDICDVNILYAAVY